MVSRLWFLYNDNRNVVLEQKMQKGGTMISKKLFMTLGLSCLLLVGCQTAHKTMPESSTLTSTGYASKEVQLISLFYDGALYLYNATGFDKRGKLGIFRSDSFCE